MSTLSEVRLKVLRVLSDEDGAQYSTDLLQDGIEAAHIAVLPWVYKRSEQTLVADEETVSFALPSDFYKVISIFDSESGYYIPEGVQAAFSQPGDNVNVNQEFAQYPEGYLTLLNAPTENLVMKYAAYWSVPTGENDSLEVPSTLIMPIVLFTASYALLEKSSNVSSIRQWADKNVDAGTPVMNPMRDQSNFYLSRFTEAMKLLPALSQGFA